MSINCQHPHHLWTVSSTDLTLVPGLDLVPGRRCLCGTHVIVNSHSATFPASSLRIAPIDSPTAAQFIYDHPALKTW